MKGEQHPVDIERVRESLEVRGFHVGALLGEGSFGVVHSVTDREGDAYAVKTTSRTHHRRGKNRSERRPEEASGDERAIFRALAARWARCPAEYVGVVRVFSVVEEGPLCHFVMERLAGSNLEEYVGRYRPAGLEEGEVRAVIREVLRGLAFLHRMGVLHRDVKPANVYVEHDAEGRIRDVKLVDFGLGRAFGAFGAEESIEYSGSGTALTRSVVGSPLYRSPAVEQGWGYGTDCDLWGAGNVLYYAATGGKTLVAPVPETYRKQKMEIWESCCSRGYRFDGIASGAVNFLLQALLGKYPMGFERKSAAAILEDYWFKY